LVIAYPGNFTKNANSVSLTNTNTNNSPIDPVIFTNELPNMANAILNNSTCKDANSLADFNACIEFLVYMCNISNANYHYGYTNIINSSTDWTKYGIPWSVYGFNCRIVQKTGCTNTSYLSTLNSELYDRMVTNWIGNTWNQTPCNPLIVWNAYGVQLGSASSIYPGNDIPNRINAYKATVDAINYYNDYSNNHDLYINYLLSPADYIKLAAAQLSIR
jgi:hypothetical protein